MTDNTETQDLEEAEPEVNSYQITVTRVYEADYTNRELTALMERHGAESKTEAIEIMLLQREKGNVRPTEKLLALDTQANESPNY